LISWTSLKLKTSVQKTSRAQEDKPQAGRKNLQRCRIKVLSSIYKELLKTQQKENYLILKMANSI